MSDDPSKLPFALGFGRATRAIVQQYLFISFGVVAFLILASLPGRAAFRAAIVFHEGSTNAEVLNALRLLGLTWKDEQQTR